MSQPCGDVVNFVDGVYLQRNGTNFTYAGKKVCLYGSTIYSSNGGDAPSYNWKHANFPQRIDWNLNLAQQATLNVIRPSDQFNDASDDPYNPIIWANMDYLVAQARDRHMFVLMDLSSFANNLKNKGLNPYDPAQADEWQEFINFVTNRYKNAPNISNYSITGEVHQVNSSQFPKSTTQGYLDFFTRTTNAVYDGETAAGGGHHLIAAGGFSHLSQSDSGIPWQQIFSAPHVDMASIHVYPGNVLDPINSNNDLITTIPMIGVWAKQNNKPAMVEEYGFQQAIGDAAFASAMRTVQQALLDNDFQAQIIWNLGPESSGAQTYDVNPSRPLAWAQLVAGATNFYGTTNTSCQQADINQDSFVDLSDYSILVANFLKATMTNSRADVNRDGFVDLSDYSLLVREFLKTC